MASARDIAKLRNRSYTGANNLVFHGLNLGTMNEILVLLRILIARHLQVEKAVHINVDIFEGVSTIERHTLLFDVAGGYSKTGRKLPVFESILCHVFE